MGWDQHPPDSEMDMDTRDDDQIIMAMRENPEQFTVLYERYFQRIYRYCLRRTNDEQLAEDLCSEIFIKIMNKLDSYRLGGNFAAWLFRIAHNTVVDHYRKHKKLIAIDHVELKSEVTMTKTIGNQLLVEELLSGLSEEDRELLSLRFDAELSAPDIAELTGKTANAVRVQIYRLLKRLRGRYAMMMGDKS